MRMVCYVPVGADPGPPGQDDDQHIPGHHSAGILLRLLRIRRPESTAGEPGNFSSV